MIHNIAGYKFVTLHDLPALREQLLERAKQHGLYGTILLAPEGINISMAGEEAHLKTYIEQLEVDERFTGIDFRWSTSDSIPFRKMMVKLKKEIIPVGDNTIRPEDESAQSLSPADFCRMYDHGEDMLVLDTRNDYEIEHGKFERAIDIDLQNFRDFESKVAQLPDEYKQKTVVTYCTGGIRCEKAALIMERAGFENVYQLEGGILAYFKACGHKHYEGECFVFDERGAINADTLTNF